MTTPPHPLAALEAEISEIRRITGNDHVVVAIPPRMWDALNASGDPYFQRLRDAGAIQRHPMGTQTITYAGPLDYIGHYLAGQEPPDPRTDTSEWAVLKFEMYDDQSQPPANYDWFVQLVEQKMDDAARDALAAVCKLTGAPLPEEVFAQWRPLWRGMALAAISDIWKDPNR